MRNDNPNIIALLLAGGNGLRLQSARPKQFIEAEGESVLLHTMKNFEQHPQISEIWVVCNPEWNRYVESQAVLGHITKFRQGIVSGETAHDSLMNGIHALADAGTAGDTIVMVHESVRPLISQQIISSNILTCKEHGNAVTALYSHESYARTEGGMTTRSYIPREQLMRAQTPITFRMKSLLDIAEKAKLRSIHASQSLFTLANEVEYGPLHLVEGSMLNFKITLPMDVEVYKRLRDISYN